MTGKFDITGKVACVTGASSGIGRAMATAFAEAGAKVVGVARRAEALETWSAETNGDTAFVAADLGDPSAMAGIAAEIAAPFGSPDILMTAAGLKPSFAR